MPGMKNATRRVLGSIIKVWSLEPLWSSWQTLTNSAVTLQLGPDTKALAYALFDRAIFTMKVKRTHCAVLAAACLLLSTKLLEDSICRDLGKFLIKQANLAFSKVNFTRFLLRSIQWNRLSVIWSAWRWCSSRNSTGRLTTPPPLICCSPFLSCHPARERWALAINRRTWWLIS